MPVLMVRCNKQFNNKAKIMQELSASVAVWLGKSEAYVLLDWQYNADMLFGGSTDALAYVELKNLELEAYKCAILSEKICQKLEQLCGINSKRIYIEFSASPRAMWGWDATTFENK